MKKTTVWTDEMKADLVRMHREGMKISEIAERMGLDFSVVENAVNRAKRGVWGEKYRIERQRDKIAQTNDEALAQGLSYGQLQIKKMRESQSRTAQEVETMPETAPGVVEPELRQQETPKRTDLPIDMLEAIDVLTACAQIFGYDKLLEVRGSATLNKAGITFTRGNNTYVLSVSGLDANE